jgi:hypothetical protein
MTFNFGEYKDWSTHGTWYSPRHPFSRAVCVKLQSNFYFIFQCVKLPTLSLESSPVFGNRSKDSLGANIIQLMTFDEVNTRIDQQGNPGLHP